jgi:hypothetical protein
MQEASMKRAEEFFYVILYGKGRFREQERVQR